MVLVSIQSLFLLGLFFCQCQGFAVTLSHSSGLISTLLSATPSTVSVCTAELCCCQEEGMGGDEILQDLLSRKLPYPIEEAPCLGACGGGAMVAIDFDNGTSALVSGIDETLSELSLSSASDALMQIPESDSTSEAIANAPVTLQSNEETPDITAAVQTESPTVATTQAAPKKAPQPLVDVRERMRAEAAEEQEETSNPWLQAASYLAGKATNKLFGGNDG